MALQHSVLALGLLLGTATAAMAQSSPEQRRDAFNEEFQRTIDVVERARLAGNCSGRDQGLASLAARIAGLRASGTWSDSDVQAYSVFLDSIRERPCPPPAAEEAPPSADLTGPSTPPSTPPEDGMRPADDERVRVATQMLDPIDRALEEAERLRRAGDCVGHEAALRRLVELRDGYLRGVRPLVNDAVTDALRRHCPAGGSVSYNSVQIAGGYGETTIPRTGYGFQRDGAPGTSPDRPAAFSTERVEAFGFGFGLQIGGLSADLGYAEGNASNRTEVAASTTGGARGYPYTDNGPSTSTGIGGNVPLVVETGVSFNEIASRIAYGWGVGRTLNRGAYFLDDDGNVAAVNADGTARNGRDTGRSIERGSVFLDDNAIVIYVAADGTVRDRDHRGIVSITTPVVATQTLDQDVDELELGLTLGARAIVPLGTRARFTLGGEAGAYLYDFDLRSVETNAQNFGPAADRAFTNTIEDGKSGIGLFAAARAKLGFDIGSVGPEGRGQVEVFVAGEANYRSDRAQVVNPFSGDFVLAGGTTRLGTDDVVDWRVSIGLVLRPRFGQRRQH